VSVRVDAERIGAWQIVRWCPVGKQWEPDEGRNPDQSCSVYVTHTCSGCQPSHLLRRRKMLICSICQMAFLKQESFNSHECFDAY